MSSLAMLPFEDTRQWMNTELPDEIIAVGQPVPGIEILSASGSTRQWTEPLHETFAIAAVQHPPTAAEWSTRGRSLTTRSGELMAINSGDGHRTRRVHVPAAFDLIKVAPSWIEAAQRALGARPRFWFRQPSVKHSGAFEAVQRLIRSVATGAPPFVTEAACHDAVNVIVSELGESNPPRNTRLDSLRDPRLRRAREFLIEDLSQRPRLEALAQVVGLGKSQLCALFQEAHGTSVGQYWLACRLNKAKDLLLAGTPAKFVATDLGFFDEAHFSRFFRRQYGLPPARWVKLYRTNTPPVPGPAQKRRATPDRF